MNIQNKRILILISLVLLAIIVFIIGLRGVDPKQGTSQEFSDPTGPAIINNSGVLFQYISSSKNIDSLRDGLSQFARNSSEKTSSDIVFIIKDASINDKTVTITGNFSNNKDLIVATIQKKNNGIIGLKIENTKTGKIMDNELDVNNKEDQFIGSLTKEYNDYYLSYSEADNLYVVELKSYIKNPETIIEKDFMDNIERVPLRYEEYIILPPPKQVQAPTN